MSAELRSRSSLCSTTAPPPAPSCARPPPASPGSSPPSRGSPAPSGIADGHVSRVMCHVSRVQGGAADGGGAVPGQAVLLHPHLARILRRHRVRSLSRHQVSRTSYVEDDLSPTHWLLLQEVYRGCVQVPPDLAQLAADLRGGEHGRVLHPARPRPRRAGRQVPAGSLGAHLLSPAAAPPSLRQGEAQL